MAIYYSFEDYSLSFLGGIIIAIAATLNLLFYGKITGISGIFSGTVMPTSKPDFAWKSSFLAGFVSIPYLIYLIAGRSVKVSDSYTLVFFDSIQQTVSDLHILGWLLGGFLVGFGTKLGNGCTSGHGVCGLPRLSLRSLVAVCVFMGAGFAIATIRYHGQILTTGQFYDVNWDMFSLIIWLLVLVGWVAALIVLKSHAKFMLFELLVGSIFGLGLVLSGMCRKSKVLGFLTIKDNWDPSLAFVMGGAVLFNLASFHYIIKVKKVPVVAEKLDLPTATQLEGPMIIGNAIFGLGWGLAGFCPGPALVDLFNITHCFGFLLLMTLGQFCAGKVQESLKAKEKKMKELDTKQAPLLDKQLQNI